MAANVRCVNCGVSLDNHNLSPRACNNYKSTEDIRKARFLKGMSDLLIQPEMPTDKYVKA